MRTPASIAGHPIHPMLVPIAIGCFVFSFASDLLYAYTGHFNPWGGMAQLAILGGIIGALAAAIPGLIDLMSLPQGPLKKTALTHMSINLVVVALYVVNAWVRYGNPDSQKGPMLLSLIGICLLLVSGWLGGKMVFEHGVGVDTGAPPR